MNVLDQVLIGANKVIKSLSNKIDNNISAVEALSGTVETLSGTVDSVNADMAKSSEVQSVLSKLNSNTQTGAVKSVQIGTCVCEAAVSGKDPTTVTISYVNPSKCMVLINALGHNGSGISNAILYAFNTTSITIKTNYAMTVGYQVIEFY